jgi:hypothetical protein
MEHMRVNTASVSMEMRSARALMLTSIAVCTSGKLSSSEAFTRADARLYPTAIAALVPLKFAFKYSSTNKASFALRRPVDGLTELLSVRDRAVRTLSTFTHDLTCDFPTKVCSVFNSIPQDADGFFEMFMIVSPRGFIKA